MVTFKRSFQNFEEFIKGIAQLKEMYGSIFSEHFYFRDCDLTNDVELPAKWRRKSGVLDSLRIDNSNKPTLIIRRNFTSETGNAIVSILHGGAKI